MNKPLHSNFNELPSQEINEFDSFTNGKLKARRSTINKILAYSKALSINGYQSIGTQETILN